MSKSVSGKQPRNVSNAQPLVYKQLSPDITNTFPTSSSAGCIPKDEETAWIQVGKEWIPCWGTKQSKPLLTLAWPRILCQGRRIWIPDKQIYTSTWKRHEQPLEKLPRTSSHQGFFSWNDIPFISLHKMKFCSGTASTRVCFN